MDFRKNGYHIADGSLESGQRNERSEIFCESITPKGLSLGKQQLRLDCDATAIDNPAQILQLP
jgi:hypothetical protein